MTLDQLAEQAANRHVATLFEANYDWVGPIERSAVKQVILTAIKEATQAQREQLEQAQATMAGQERRHQHRMDAFEAERAKIAEALPGWASDTSDVPLIDVLKACIATFERELTQATKRAEKAEQQLAQLQGKFHAQVVRLDQNEQATADAQNARYAAEQRLAQVALTARREELETTRRIGAQMANVCWNLSRATGVTLSPRETEVMRELWLEWDAIQRSEQSAGATK